MRKQIQTIFFDLGNVLFNVDHTQTWKKTKRKTRLPSDELFKRFYSSGDMIEHMIGSIDDRIFFERLKTLIEYEGKTEELVSIWQKVFQPIKERLETVSQLSERYPLGIISNISPIHSRFLEHEIVEMKCFQYPLFSWEIGYMKPRKELFIEAIKQSRTAPEKCLFIDDQNQHVEAAKKIGMNAFQLSLKEDLSHRLDVYLT